MTNAWDERRKALENEYFHKHEQELIERLKAQTKEKTIRGLCRNRCPKCGEPITAMVFRDVPLDKCTGCGGVWLGPRDLQILSEKDHRTWFDKWFREKEETVG